MIGDNIIFSLNNFIFHLYTLLITENSIIMIAVDLPSSLERLTFSYWYDIDMIILGVVLSGLHAFFTDIELAGKWYKLYTWFRFL